MTTRFTSDFLDTARRRFSVADNTITHAAWLEQNVVLKGRPFTTKEYPFQKQILNDNHPNLTVIKVSQVGLTTLNIAKALSFIRRNRGVTAMYTMPSEDLFKKFSQSRLKPFFDENRTIFASEDVKRPVLNTNLVQIDTSFLHITGTTEGDATSTPADALFHDEVDLMDQDLRSLFQSRLQNSNYKITHKFSTPTHEGFGIDADYAISDKHEYLAYCERCRKYCIPQFTRDFVHIPGLPDEVEKLHHLLEEHCDLVDLDNAFVCCPNCRRALDLDHAKREWVAERPQRSNLYRGYRIRPFSTSKLSIRYIVTQLFEYKRRGKLRRWYNTVIGEAFTEAGTRLTREDLLPLFTGNPNPVELPADEEVFLGIDVGIVCHLVVLSQRRGIVRFETVPSDDLLSRVGALLKQYRVIGGACDRHPYTPTANALRELSKGVILPVEYRGATELKFIKDELGNVTHVQAERTAAIDATIKAIRGGEVMFGGYGHQQDTIITHFMDMVRDEETDGLPRWLKTKGDDHYHHAYVFALISMRILNAQMAKDEADSRTSISFLGVDFKESVTGILVPKQTPTYSRIQGIL